MEVVNPESIWLKLTPPWACLVPPLSFLVGYLFIKWQEKMRGGSVLIAAKLAGQVKHPTGPISPLIDEVDNEIAIENAKILGPNSLEAIMDACRRANEEPIKMCEDRA